MPALPPTANHSRRIAIVGAGITGLAAALRTADLDPAAELVVLEGSDRVGGVLRTEQSDGFLIEHSADNFITDQPGVLDFCRRVGLESQLLPTRATQRRAFIAHRGRLEPVPEGFLLMAPASLGSIWQTRLLSLPGKLRLAAERLVPQRPAFDPVTEPHLEESLAQFATRRLGREAFEHLVQPLVSGIYSADPEQLSVAATLPRFLDMERRYGSLTAAMRAKARESGDGRRSAADSGARYSLFMAPRLGMNQLTEAAAGRLSPGALRLGSRVLSVEKQADGWRLVVEGQPDSILADGLILAAPAAVSASLLRPTDEALAAAIDSIPLGGCSVVCLGFRRTALKQPPAGFGFVVPAVENSPILAASYSSEKFSGRADDEHFLVRVFIGGAGKEHLAALSDEELQELAIQGMRDWLGLEESPVLRRVARWHGAMPQYHRGHLAVVQRIEALVARHAGLAVAGNAYRGVGIPQCIQSGQAAAEQVHANR